MARLHFVLHARPWGSVLRPAENSTAPSHLRVRLSLDRQLHSGLNLLLFRLCCFPGLHVCSELRRMGLRFLLQFGFDRSHIDFHLLSGGLQEVDFFESGLGHIGNVRARDADCFSCERVEVIDANVLQFDRLQHVALCQDEAFEPNQGCLRLLRILQHHEQLLRLVHGLLP